MRINPFVEKVRLQASYCKERLSTLARHGQKLGEAGALAIGYVTALWGGIWNLCRQSFGLSDPSPRLARNSIVIAHAQEQRDPSALFC